MPEQGLALGPATAPDQIQGVGYAPTGAVCTGAFFGDKVSPLSDTTNLAPAVTGTNLFDHIRNMMPTTIPAMLIAFLIYLIAGYELVDGRPVDFGKIETITRGLEQNFNLSWVALLPAALVLLLALMAYVMYNDISKLVT